MIVLIFDGGTGLSDYLNITVGTPSAVGALEWYCSWNTDPAGVTPLPYGRNYGVAGGAIPATTQMTPAIPGVLPVYELDIREVTVHNTRGEPVNVEIDFSNGVVPPNLTYRLFSCVLGGGCILSYNAIPGVDGASWKIFDGSGHLI